jgi:hypothetical protein
VVLKRDAARYDRFDIPSESKQKERHACHDLCPCDDAIGERKKKKETTTTTTTFMTGP